MTASAPQERSWRVYDALMDSKNMTELVERMEAVMREVEDSLSSVRARLFDEDSSGADLACVSTTLPSRLDALATDLETVSRHCYRIASALGVYEPRAAVKSILGRTAGY